MDHKIRVILADDHQMMRAGLRALLQNQPDIEVVGEAEDGRAAVAMAAALEPDVVVMDIAMPDLNGIEATRQITGNGPRPKVIALSGRSDRRAAMSMLQAGASGYILKAGAFAELAIAIATVVSNKVYLSPDVAGAVVGDVINTSSPDSSSAFSQLSPREREILQLLAEGKSTKEVAIQLNLSAKTVETHRKNIMDKLELFSVAELTKYAIREGITALDV